MLDKSDNLCYSINIEEQIIYYVYFIFNQYI